MIEAGLAIVLATDFNPGSSPTPSMPMNSFARMHANENVTAEGISAATINAAYSLNRGERIGSLETGKLANFAVFDCERLSRTRLLVRISANARGLLARGIRGAIVTAANH